MCGNRRWFARLDRFNMLLVIFCVANLTIWCFQALQSRYSRRHLDFNDICSAGVDCNQIFDFTIRAKPRNPTSSLARDATSHATHRRRSISPAPMSKFHLLFSHTHTHPGSLPPSHLSHTITAKMAPSNLPPGFNATAQDIEMLLSAQCHLGSKNLQVHMEPYLWKTRPDGINVINIGKTWYIPHSSLLPPPPPLTNQPTNSTNPY